MEVSSGFSESTHKTLAKQLPACQNSGAFSGTIEGALFLPDAKDEKKPPRMKGLSCFSDGDCTLVGLCFQL